MTKLPATLTLCTVLLGVGPSSLCAGQTETGFVNKIYNDNDGAVKYVVFVPKEYTGQKAYPVILFLHGAGQTGTDGKKQAQGGLAKAIRDKKQRFPFVAIFPQSQKGG
jgi:predicted peptidase